MKVHIYGRVSKCRGERYGNSNIDIQFDECEMYCNNRNWSSDQIVYHVQEGTARNGDNLNELYAILQVMEPGDILVVYTIDRLTRSMFKGIEFLEDVLNKGCHIESVYDGLIYGRDSNNDRLAYDRYKIRDIINHAELESDRISVRNRRAAKHRKQSRKGSKPMLSTTRFQCRKRRLNELDNNIDIDNLDEHMNVKGVATRSMLNGLLGIQSNQPITSKKRRTTNTSPNKTIDLMDDIDAVVITTKNTDRSILQNKNRLISNTLTRYANANN